MMIDYLFTDLEMKGEEIRIAIAVLATLIASWFDLTNKRNVPNSFLYAFLGIAVIINLVFFNEVSKLSFIIGGVIFLVGYLIYKNGLIGGADVYVITSISILLPIFPSYINMPINMPLVFSLIILSGILFSLYFLFFVFTQIIIRGKKGNYIYLLLGLGYLIILWLIYEIGVFNYIYIFSIGILALASVLYLTYKEAILESFAKKVTIDEVEEEDIAAVELMEKEMQLKVKRLLDKNEIENLKNKGIKELIVYKNLPPFLPFVLAALIICLIYGDIVLLSLNW